MPVGSALYRMQGLRHHVIKSTCLWSDGGNGSTGMLAYVVPAVSLSGISPNTLFVPGNRPLPDVWLAVLRHHGCMCLTKRVACV